MTVRTRLSLGVLGAFGVFAILSWKLGPWLGLAGGRLWILRIGLLVLGAVAAGLIYWLVKRRTARQRASAGIDDLEALFSQAQERLASAPGLTERRLTALPLVLIIGPEGSAKTSTIAHSGVAPTLLAGHLSRGGEVAPTRDVNIWFANGVVLVEVGGRLLAHPVRWRRLLQLVRPPRLVPVLTGRPQAPRAAAVCFSCEDLVRPEAVEVAETAGRKLRDLLSDAAQALGIRLPVYVLLTKADRLKAFPEFAQQLSGDEVRMGLGATLPLPPPAAAAGTVADREARRIKDALDQLYMHVATLRLLYLPRHANADQRSTAYEFPRELRKATTAMLQLLSEISRPRELEMSPYVRGFYLTGVRPLVRADAAAEPAQPVAAPSSFAGATQVFDGRAALQAAEPPQAGAAVTRRMPQWVFVDQVFREVLTGDRTALGLTQGGLRLRQLRRLTFACLAVFGVLAAITWTVSFTGNRRLETRALRAARDLVGLAPGEPTGEAVTRLDRVRGVLMRLDSNAQRGAPLRQRWGLYTGNAVRDRLRAVYVTEMRDLMLADIGDSLRGDIRRMSANPEQTSFDTAWAVVTGYLMTTSRAQRLEADRAAFLVSRWPDGRALQESERATAQAQLAFLAGGLCEGGACAREHDGEVGRRACDLLASFSGVDRVYRNLVGRAASGPELGIDDEYVRTPYRVPAEYTKQAWETIHAALERGDVSPAGDAWVYESLECAGAARPDVAGLTTTLRDRYQTEYVAQWRRFLREAQVQGFDNVDRARRALGSLSGNRSPLLQLLALTASNTGMDSTVLGRVFQPVHQVTPPETGDRLIGDANSEYVNQLRTLQTQLEQVGRPGEDREGARGQAQAARDAAARLATSFSAREEAAEVSQNVRRLIEFGPDRVLRMLGDLPRNRVNAEGRAFCTEFGALARLYPFNAQSRQEATVDQLTRLLREPDGRLWQFNAQSLNNVMIPQGDGWIADPRADVKPRAAFAQFFSRAARVSRALFRPGSQGPEFQFALLRLVPPQGVSRLVLTVDGRSATYTQADQRSSRISWVAAQARDVALQATVGNAPVELRRYTGTWALFRLFGEATWEGLGSGNYRLTWNLDYQGRQYRIEGQVSVEAGREPLLQPGYFSGLTCPQPVW
jgi:type VI secretion system protein ImpL